jgi:MFS family permease
MRRSVRGLIKMIPMASAVFGIGLISFGFSRSFWLSVPIMFITGYGMIQGVTASNTILQTLVDEKMRGRVMSYYTMAFVGMAPFGSLLAGALAHVIGAPRTVVVSGVACVLGSLWFWTRLPGIRREVRPIYERLGIVPRVQPPIESPIEIQIEAPIEAPIEESLEG